jgi:hypothetical protein
MLFDEPDDALDLVFHELGCRDEFHKLDECVLRERLLVFDGAVG